jgi:hypothetical protein
MPSTEAANKLYTEAMNMASEVKRPPGGFLFTMQTPTSYIGVSFDIENADLIQNPASETPDKIWSVTGRDGNGQKRQGRGKFMIDAVLDILKQIL